MKQYLPVKILTIMILSLGLCIGCAAQGKNEASGAAATKASPEAMAAIGEASSAIKKAKANDWLWRDTEKFLKDAQAAADAGDNSKAISLAKKAKFEAEAAVVQYHHEKENPRGL